MSSYTLPDLGPDDYEPVPTAVESFWSREIRSYITVLRDQQGNHLDSLTDGTKADRDASRRFFEGQIAAGKLDPAR